MQRNFNIAVDPLVLRQQQKASPFPKKKKFQHLDTTLSFEDGEKLLNLWRQNNFADFNSWVQVAKAQINTDMIESSNEINKGAKKTFTCSLTLTFEGDSSQVIISNGFGRNKKDAKKAAIEKIVIELIQNGEINRGIKDLSFLNAPLINMQQPVEQSQMLNPQKENSEENTQKKNHKLLKRIQDFLKKDEFHEACEALCLIIMQKKPEWNEIVFLWSYALLKKDYASIKAVIDLIQFKRVQPTLEEMKSHDDISMASRDEKEEKIKREFIKKYGNYRLKSDNPYDILDIFNVEASLLELADPTRENQEVSDEEAYAELIKDPFSREISRAFVLDSSEGLPLLSSVQSTASLTIPDPKLLNVFDAVETNRLLHQESLSGNQNNYSQGLHQSFNNMGGDYQANPMLRIDENTSREIKNPNINYISYKLLNELYDSLLYVNDMNFALRVAELLYTRLKLDDAEFINNFASLYYANKKNMLTVELLESVFENVTKYKNKISNFVVTLDGSIEKIGNKYTQDVLLFTPQEPQDQVQRKICKRGLTDSESRSHQIGEGEFVKLTSFSQADLLSAQLNALQGNILPHLNQIPGFGQIALNTNNNAQSSQGEIIACIKEIQKDYKLKLFILPTKEQSELLTDKGRVWKITKLKNKSSYDRISEALEIFTTQTSVEPPLAKILLSPCINNNREVQQLVQTRVYFPNQAHKPPVTNLNSSQQSALQAASSNLLTLIHGPPRTGKTTTCVEIILEWLRNSTHPILACSETNIAVDILYDELKAAGLNVIRVGPDYDDKHDLRGDKNYSAYQSFLNNKQYHNAYNIKFGIIKRRIGEADVVCTTCTQANSEFLKGMKFTRVIVDEASQATELATMIPLLKGCKQLVLAGDYRYRAPTVKSNLAQSKGMMVSLFEKLIKQGVAPNFLNVQYKMHPSIAEFPSLKFYNNMLENGVEDDKLNGIAGFNMPNPTVRVAFVNVKGLEQVRHSSVQNTREVKAVVEILMNLLNSGNEIDSISVLTNYEAQEHKIRNEVNIQAKKYPKLFGIAAEDAHQINRGSVLNYISLVENDHGVESNIVIFSAVRSNKIGNLGALKDPRKLNLVLTRARKSLIIIGDMETLVNDATWRDWIFWARKNKIVMQYQ